MRTDVPYRVAVAGAELQMMVLTADVGGCVGIDLESGAFVRASYTPDAERMPAPFDVVVGRLAPAAEPPDASRPEAVVLETAPRTTGRLSARKADRYLQPLQHPRRGPLLGFAGRVVPYWTLTGDRPSLTLIELAAGAQLRRGSHGYECRFTWQIGRHQLPLGDRRLAAQLEDVGWPRFSSRDLHRFLGYPVRRLLIVLTPPHRGYCHKVVAALLPGS